MAPQRHPRWRAVTRNASIVFCLAALAGVWQCFQDAGPLWGASLDPNASNQAASLPTLEQFPAPSPKPQQEPAQPVRPAPAQTVSVPLPDVPPALPKSPLETVPAPAPKLASLPQAASNPAARKVDKPEDVTGEVLRQVANVVELQPNRQEQRISNANGDFVRLINLNPATNAWFLLEFSAKGETASFHLEAAALQGRPDRRAALRLYRDGLVVSLPGQKAAHYPFWPAQGAANGPAAADDGKLNDAPVLAEVFKSINKSTPPYVPLCDGCVYLRHTRAGASTRLEYATDFLRTTSIGAWFVETAKPYLIQAPERGIDVQGGTNDPVHAANVSYPAEADIDETQKGLSCAKSNTGIETEVTDKYHYGKWYKASRQKGIFVSLIKPSVVDPAILSSYKDRVATLGAYDKDRKESEALVYLAALDMAYFHFGFSLGADHPKVEWSSKITGEKEGAGPDGFGTLAPLCRVGALPPYFLPFVRATFVGGFKREHGVFGRGPFGKVNRGSHYGFGENGVVCSSPQPGLATAAINRNGDLELFTFPNERAGFEQRFLHFRQNGLPIIEGMTQQGESIPGQYCNNWHVAIWSGDQYGNVVTPRSSIALQESNGRHYLIFAYFSGATPNAMARVFQAYHCRYAMQLDMNTPNYCYFSLYEHDAQGHISAAANLHKDMRDGTAAEHNLKFVEKNDTRDFFYVIDRM